MGLLFLKIGAILFLFIGETLSICAEIILAKRYSLDQPFWRLFFIGFIFLTFTGALIITGYLLGIKAFKNIWIVSVASITSILIMEPIVGYLVFRQLPTKGALIGLILGAIGFAAAVFYK